MTEHIRNAIESLQEALLNAKDCYNASEGAPQYLEFAEQLERQIDQLQDLSKKVLDDTLKALNDTLLH